MEFSILPKSTYRNSGFARFAIRTSESRPTQTYITSGFYYIGKDSTNIEKLVKLYKRGYASESIENAKSEMKRSLVQEKNIVPEVIFCESSFDFAAVKSLAAFLSKQPALANVPFIVDANDMTEAALTLYRKQQIADEILFIGQSDESSLLRKVTFLKKVKAKAIEVSDKLRDEAVFVPTAAKFHAILKRAFDIIISAAAITALSPLFLIIAGAVYLESRGSVFYIAKRAGRGYRIFNFYKFRTMFMGADQKIKELAHLNQYAGGDANAAFFKINNDPRITKVGSFLRNTSLDELPQLFNVLLGDMSLVGNRPLPLYEAATLTSDINAQRFLAPAGITGLWQIKKRGKEEMSIEERINLDIDYAAKHNFMYDLWIMANTPSALMQKSSA